MPALEIVRVGPENWGRRNATGRLSAHVLRDTRNAAAADSRRRILKKTTAHGLIAVALVVACALPAEGQTTPPRHGAWGGLGLGQASASLSCNACGVGGRVNGSTLSLLFGGTPNPHVRAGGDFGFWWHDLVADTSELALSFNATLYYYPRIRSGFFIEGGLGLAGFMRGIPRPYHGAQSSVLADSGVAQGTGLGLAIGVGYDVRVVGSLTVTPRVTYSYGIVGDVRNPDSSVFATGWSQSLLAVEITIGFMR